MAFAYHAGYRAACKAEGQRHGSADIIRLVCGHRDAAGYALEIASCLASPLPAHWVQSWPFGLRRLVGAPTRPRAACPPGTRDGKNEHEPMWPDRRLLDLFKTEFPIVLAPMAGVMDADLVIAAAQGGALGSLPCAMLSVEKAREQVNIIRQRVSAPVNMNFFCHTAGRCRSRARGRLEAAAGALLRGIRARSVGADQRRQPRAVRRRDVRAGRGTEAGSGQLPFRPAGSGAAERASRRPAAS